MKKSVSFVVPFLCLFSFTAFSTPSLDFKYYRPNRWDLKATEEYIKPDGNFTKSGSSYDALPSGYTATLAETSLETRYALDGRSAFFGGIGAIYESFQSPSDTKNNSAVSDVRAGYDYLFLKDPIKLIPEVSIDYPVLRPDFNSNIVASNEGAMAVTGRLIAILERSIFAGAPYIGFIYRDQGRSNLILYGIPAEVRFSRLFVGASLEGYSSVGYDRDTNDDSVRNAYFARVMGDSKIFAAVNPSLLTGSGWVGFYPFRHWKMILGASSTLTGANTAHYTSGFLQVSYALAPAPDYGRTTVSGDDPDDNVRFRENTDDGVDQRLFEKKSKTDVKKDLNDTEMQIEMRAKKKLKDPPQ